MTQLEGSRLSEIQARKSIIIDELARQAAHENDPAMTVAAWNEVLEEIAHEVEMLQTCPIFLSDELRPEIEPVVDLWCRLEIEALSLELFAILKLICQWRSQHTQTDHH